MKNKKRIVIGLVVLVVICLYAVLRTADFSCKDKMLEPRFKFAATLLKDNTILITGGVGGDDGFKTLDSAEIYDPNAHKSHYVGNLNIPRARHNEILLDDGRVLIVGGTNPKIPFIKQAEIYDPKTEKFSLTGELKVDGLNELVLLKLRDGKILVAGGGGKFEGPRKSNEMYDPKTGEFSLVAFSKLDHMKHTASLLKNSNVLIAGGGWDHKNKKYIWDETEIYNPKINKFIDGPKMQKKRASHKAVTLTDDRILILDGVDVIANAYKEAEIYDPKTNKFVYAGEMNILRREFDPVLLPNGKIYIVGGDDPGSIINSNNYRNTKTTCEVYDPKKETFEVTKVCMKPLKYGYSSFLLPDGKLIIVGGGNPTMKRDEKRKYEIINTKEIK